MDHSGISMSTGSFGDPWDSGQVGWIVATPEKIRKEYSVKTISKKTREKVESVLRAEVGTYDDYLTGNVWAFSVEDHHPCETCGATVKDESDSCGGFIGSDALSAMKEHVDEKYHAALEAAWNNR
jgi:hypothetical protein